MNDPFFSWSTVIDIIVAGVGIYLIYLIYLAKYKGIIHQTFIWRRDDNPNKCRDKEGFVNYLFPRVVICGVVLFIDGLLGVLNRHIFKFTDKLDLYSIFVTFAVIIVFGFSCSRAMKNYFD